MSFFASHPLPTPKNMTPRNHACQVIVGSRPMVRVNTHAANTATTNCSQIIRPIYQKETARG